MSEVKRRPLLALVGSLLMWSGLAASILFAAAAIWLLIQGSSPAWVILAVTIPVGALGYWLVRISGVPFSEALNS